MSLWWFWRKPKPLPTFDEWCAANGYVNDPKVDQIFVVTVHTGDSIADLYKKPTEARRARLLANMQASLIAAGIIRASA